MACGRHARLRHYVHAALERFELALAERDKQLIEAVIGKNGEPADTVPGPPAGN